MMTERRVDESGKNKDSDGGNMHRAFSFVSKFWLFVFVLTGAAMTAGFTQSALAQSCGIGIGKSAEGAGDLEFHFVTESSEGDGEFTLVDGEGTGGPFPESIVVRELPTEGWVLSDVDCEGEGVTFTRLSDGVRVDCDEQSGNGACIFINIPFTGNKIPTLSEWGMLAAALGLGVVGVFFAVRRRKAAV